MLNKDMNFTTDFSTYLHYNYYYNICLIFHLKFSTSIVKPPNLYEQHMMSKEAIYYLVSTLITSIEQFINLSEYRTWQKELKYRC